MGDESPTVVSVKEFTITTGLLTDLVSSVLDRHGKKSPQFKKAIRMRRTYEKTHQPFDGCNDSPRANF